MVLFLSSTPTYLHASGDPPGTSFVGFTLGIASWATSHELGHVIAGYSMGWELEEYQIVSVRLRPDEDFEESRGEHLAVYAAGSLGQIVPILLLPTLARSTENAYLNARYDNWGFMGVVDFPV